MSAHQEFQDAIAGYALGGPAALDPAEARALDTHLAACADCRAELAELRRVANGIGLSAIAEDPPAHLRTAVLNQAIPENPAIHQTHSVIHEMHTNHPTHSNIVPWMLAAASIALVVATGFYAMMARQQATDALNAKAAANARVVSLQRQLDGLSARIDVLSAPDAVQVKLAGQPDAPNASASVVMSPTKGMVLTAENLPALAAGTIYQLWVVTKQAPVSIGTFEVAADGSVTGTMPISRNASIDPVAIAVTIEPAGGVPAPTGPKVLVGVVGH